MGQGSQYVALTVKHFLDALKAVTNWNVEGKRKVMKMMMIKEIGKGLLIAAGVWMPFVLHGLGVI